MDEVSINDEKGNTFVIRFENGEYIIKKKTFYGEVDANHEEIKFVLAELEKIQKGSLKQEETKKTFNDFLEMLKTLIKNGNINDYNSLKKFVDSCSISDYEKESLMDEGMSALDIHEIIDLKNEIIDNLRNDKSSENQIFLMFDIKQNYLWPICDINMKYKEGNTYKDSIKKSARYSPVLEKELIEPVMLEVALRSKIIKNEAILTTDSIKNLGEYRLSTEENIHIGMHNVNYDFAKKLKNRCENLRNKDIITDEASRDAEIDNLQEKEHLNDNNENLTTDEYGNVFDEQGNYIGQFNEYGEIVRIKKENGFTASTLIFAATSFISSLLFILQFLLLKQ